MDRDKDEMRYEERICMKFANAFVMYIQHRHGQSLKKEWMNEWMNDSMNEWMNVAIYSGTSQFELALSFSSFT